MWRFQTLTDDELKIGEVLRQINNLIALYTKAKNTETDASLIFPHIWLGNHKAATDYNFVTDKKIAHIINVTEDVGNHFPFIAYTNFSTTDIKACANTDIINILNHCAEMIHATIMTNDSILIHCKRGHHRSASVVAYYLMKYHRTSLVEAVRLIKESRPTAFRRINCMMKILMEWESEKE